MTTPNLAISVINHPDPLGEIGIDVVVDGPLAMYRVTQDYRNGEAQAIEAIFTFPIPYGAVLLGVEAEIAGKTLSSVAMNLRAAKNRYEDAVSTGDSAIMVMEACPGLYTVNLGNLMPDEAAKLIFSFAQLLDWRGETLAVRIPMTIAPRYGQPQMRVVSVPMASSETVRYAVITMTVRDATSRGWIASSNTHSIVATTEGDDLNLAFDDGAVVMDRDVVIDLRGAPPTSNALMARDGDRTLVLASFQPVPNRHRTTKRKMVKVLVDCSGSMEGIPIDQARKAVIAILNALDADDVFSITLFGSTVVDITATPELATPHAIRRALQAAEHLTAGMNGTETRLALLHVFGQPWPADIEEADVLVITDGQTWDEEGIVAAAAEARHRLFTVGVGAAAAETLLRRIAEESGGACEMVTPRDGMAERIIRQFERMDVQRLHGQINWPSGAKDAWPQALGPIFAGDTVHAAAWFDKEPGGAVTFTAAPDAGKRSDHQKVDAYHTVSDDVGAALVKVVMHGVISETRDEKVATDLAVKHGLLTRYTNLIMVAERADRAGGLPVMRKASNMVPVREYSAMLCAPDLDSPAYLRRPSTAMFDRVVCRQPSGAIVAARVAPLPGLFDRLSRQAPQSDVLPSADRFIAALTVVSLAAVNLAWLEMAGFPRQLCESLAGQVRPDLSEHDLVIAFLYLAITEAADDRFPREQARRVRNAFAEIRCRLGVLDAIRGITQGTHAWETIIRGKWASSQSSERT
jgi:Ca-activated chloride channel family protein